MTRDRVDARYTSVDPGSGRITVAQAARSLPDILDRVCDGRETFLIVDDGVELAVLSPISERRSRTVGELARSLQEIRDA